MYTPWIAAGLLIAANAVAQEPPCGLRSVTPTARLIYPPIARAAHVSGEVIVRTELARDGSVISAEVWQGPVMLRQASLDFVKGWRTNEYGGSRTCLVTVGFTLNPAMPGDGSPSGIPTHMSSTDPLHYVINSYAPCLCDPAAEIKRRRFLGIF